MRNNRCNNVILHVSLCVITPLLWRALSHVILHYYVILRQSAVAKLLQKCRLKSVAGDRREAFSAQVARELHFRVWREYSSVSGADWRSLQLLGTILTWCAFREGFQGGPQLCSETVAKSNESVWWRSPSTSVLHFRVWGIPLNPSVPYCRHVFKEGFQRGPWIMFWNCAKNDKGYFKPLGTILPACVQGGGPQLCSLKLWKKIMFQNDKVPSNPSVPYCRHVFREGFQMGPQLCF